MKKILSLLGCLSLGTGIMASVLMVVSCDKESPHNKHNVSDVEKDIQKVIDANKKLWTAEDLKNEIEKTIPKTTGIAVKIGKSDTKIGAEIITIDATNTKEFEGKLKLNQVLNEENQHQTIFVDPTWEIIVAVDGSAPDGTTDILNIGWDNNPKSETYQQAYTLPTTVLQVPNYISPQITSLAKLFIGAQKFNCSEISYWDTSHITNMSGLFANTELFNQDISRWNTANVTNMSNLFVANFTFNGDISKWDTSKVTNMQAMFNYTTAFQGDLSHWNTANVTDMRMMFWNTSINCDLSHWNTAKVTDMGGMFALSRNFNGNISQWNVANVTNMSEMFLDAPKFNIDLAKWDTSKVTDMSGMFLKAETFNQDLSKWNVDLVTNHKNFADNPNWPKEKQPHFKTKQINFLKEY
ncbi:BspA family leucine-rich repeat surface protein [Williamsoniiplasma lucivorax]|uniref:BspA family leucine-rich repeat surface protein n=1 Tax=Williamsoniiplasma lucivorax TaxID=209274 RepID=A0A2S5RFR6_9MOLU|nr:BspA family leucine-rich repeat surface protein [Williamsoniiplasma lucivorax]PPE06153.1 hypothetical protein ELUCI_v1c04440 [Williamsoniiplasma lucivorax]